MDAADALLTSLLRGEFRALGRAMSWMEDGHPGAPALMAALWPRLGRATVVGLTGAPGAGKSTLTDRLAQALRKEGLKVGILAVDPTSPFSGGAILGDRIRMGRIAPDPGVFIRSLATRGALGGLSRATQDAIDLMDAAGFDWILVETVGVGQDEVDVVSCVHTCCVVLVPGLGDEIQALKAGIMEVADLFVLNKADRDGVEQLEAEIEGMKSLAHLGPWDPPVVKTVAQMGQGVADVIQGIRDHGVWLRQGDGLARKARERARLRFEALLAEETVRRAKRRAGSARLEAAVASIAEHVRDPYQAVALFLDESPEAPGR
ncbi:MAG TPA: methylmalonyl Co-A mutase-associated GTPase MeaB [Holophagaceae bacterium]|nr:methylmalonyl Co-A mutase-associated GTPase MeaB [Holophagaceae bacterium]